MIYLNPPFISVKGLTVLGDHADPLQWYYYPNYPRLALNPDGTPTFLFVKYKKDITTLPPGVEPGGGFLNFDVDLRVDQDVLNSAKREIRQQMNLDQDPRLVPIEFRAGTTRLIFLDAAAPPASTGTGSSTSSSSSSTSSSPADIHFVEKASYPATPSLYGDERTCFSVQLTSEGATLVEETLNAATSLVGVVYDLTFVALRPAFNIELDVRWDQVHDYLDHQFSAGVHTPWVSATVDIDIATEKLIENQTIKMKVTSFAAGASDADITKAKDSAVEWVKKFITDKFFVPSLKPLSKTDDTMATVAKSLKSMPSMFSASYSFKHLTQEEIKNLHMSISEQDATELRIVPQGHLSGLMDVLQQYPRDSFIKEVNLDDPYFKEVKVDVQAGASTSTDHIDKVPVHLEYQPNTNAPVDILLSDSNQTGHAQWSFDPALGFNYNYSYKVLFKPDAPAGVGDTVKSDVMQSNATRLVVDPRQLYSFQKIIIQAVGIPFDRYAQVEVELKYDDPTNALSLQNMVMLSQLNQSADWTIRLADPTKKAYKYRLTYYPISGRPIAGDWIDSTSPGVIVSDQYGTMLKVNLFPSGDWAKIKRMVVTLDYEDPANNVSQQDVRVFNTVNDAAEWSIHLVDPTKRDYTYAVSTVYNDGSSKTFPPISATDRSLFLSDVYKRVAKVAVSASGSAFDAAGLSKVNVKLSYDDNKNNSHASQEFNLLSSSDTGTFTYTILDPAQDSFTYTLTYFTTEGFQNVKGPTTSNAPSLVVPIGTTTGVPG